MRIGYRSIHSLAAAAILALGWPSSPLAQEPWRWPETQRIVVVGDVHGAHDELVELLQAAGILDRALAWSGGDSRLVMLGDLVDRGSGSRAVLELLMRLEREARGHGGAVHVVLGNHEVLNLIGDLRYVGAAELAAYAGDEPPEVREAAYQALVRQRPRATASESRAEFDRRYPPGFFAHRRAFAADGRYGAWLLALPTVIVIGDTAFVHGGLPAIVGERPAGEINERVQSTLRRYLALRAELAADGVLPAFDAERDAELARTALETLRREATPGGRERARRVEEFLALGAAPEIGIEGPLWYRGPSYCNPFIEQTVLEAALHRLGARLAVVGHTVTDDRRARSVLGGRLVTLDTGMTPYYRGRPAALLIEGDDLQVQYARPPERSPLEAGRIEAHGLTEPAILRLLETGEVQTADGSGRGVRLVKVTDGRTVLAAVFYPGSRDAAALELAAHRLDRLLGWHLVPPTIERAVDGEDGALQLQYADAITERERVERRAQLQEWCSIEPQVRLMHVFDALTQNLGRTADNVVYRAQSAVVKLVDHDRAFGSGREPLGAETLVLTPALRDTLRSLDESELRTAVGHWLDARQIRALLARRDALLEPLADP